MLTILIPGTTWLASGGWGPDNALFTLSARALGGCSAHATTQLLPWSGGNSDVERLAGAQMLRETIAAYPFAPGEKLNVIAHSHGGNVALAASHLGLAHRIDTLITLNKPTRLGKGYIPGPNIGDFYNIGAKGDSIQWFASDAKWFGKWSIDSHAVNLKLDTSSSNLKPHGALIWDDEIRETWWNWLLKHQASQYRAA